MFLYDLQCHKALPFVRFCEIPTKLIWIVCSIHFLYTMICNVTESLTRRTIHGSDLLFLQKESLIPPIQQSSLLLPALKKPANQRFVLVSRPLHVSNSVENMLFVLLSTQLVIRVHYTTITHSPQVPSNAKCINTAHPLLGPHLHGQLKKL